ncbi:PREDICTED: cytoskeleton-associated protein 4 [Dipodomys ordii]|uniref:Cytoskeleton-associated protein 4 n=1 Tax=Dipodomys ordii TaxID=10020 RepID=A0A1S3FD92_DIPOR|nr:PREDICTED: cytoskeleton-associated protein 4 [Dipodomys ordii]
MAEWQYNHCYFSEKAMNTGTSRGVTSGGRPGNSPPSPGAPPLRHHASCQNKPLGEGTAQAKPSAQETQATNPKHSERPRRAPPWFDSPGPPPTPGGLGCGGGASPGPPPPGAPDSRPQLAALSLAPAQREVNSGPAAPAPTPPPRGPSARVPFDTCRDPSVSASRSHAGPRFEVRQGDRTSSAGPRRLGRALHLLFYLAPVAAVAFSGWCVHHVLDKVQQVQSSHQDFSRQREELSQGLQGVEQKVQSLQATFGTFESILRSSQHKQDLTEKVVKQGESEINRISEVLQKLQNEILKDLSDGIHVVKDARERDFTSLENTVEERLTELTKSINDNIAIFTEVQKRSQKEINDVKAKVASLEESKGHKQELKALKEEVEKIQTSVKSRDRDMEALRSSLQTMESDIYTEVRELVSLKQEQQAFKEVADTERAALQALSEKLLQAEESTSRLPQEIRRLEEELRQLKAEAQRPQEDGDLQSFNALDALQKKNQGLDSRLQSVEDGVHSVQVASARQTESLESLLSKSQEHEQRLAMLQGHLEGLGSSPGADKDALAGTVRSLGEAQLALYSDVEDLKRSVGELPSTMESLQKVQEQVHTLLGQAQAAHLPPQEFLDKLASLDNLKSSVSQVESDLKMLRTAVDSLVAYSVKIETNENNLESVKGLLDDLRNDLDRLFVKVEKIHEKI